MAHLRTCRGGSTPSLSALNEFCRRAGGSRVDVAATAVPAAAILRKRLRLTFQRRTFSSQVSGALFVLRSTAPPSVHLTNRAVCLARQAQESSPFSRLGRWNYLRLCGSVDDARLSTAMRGLTQTKGITRQDRWRPKQQAARCGRSHCGAGPGRSIAAYRIAPRFGSPRQRERGPSGPSRIEKERNERL